MEFQLSESEAQRNLRFNIPWVEEQDWILEPLLDYLIPYYFNLDNVWLVKRLVKLKAKYGISVFDFYLLFYLLRRKSVLVHTISKISFKETHAFATDKVVSLFHDFFNSWMTLGLYSKNSSTNFFLSIGKKYWLFNYGHYAIFESQS